MRTVQVLLALTLVAAAWTAPVESPPDSDIRTDSETECQFDGATYADGSRIEDATDLCAVRLCIDGAVRTTQLQCIVRDDCEGRRQPGRCCLSYNHCPALGKYPQGPAEPYPANAPLPAGAPESEVPTPAKDELVDNPTAEEAPEEKASEDIDPEAPADTSSESEDAPEEKEDNSSEEEEVQKEAGPTEEIQDEEVEGSGENNPADLNLSGDDTFAQYAELEEVKGLESAPEPFKTAAGPDIVTKEDQAEFSKQDDAEGSELVSQPGEVEIVQEDREEFAELDDIEGSGSAPQLVKLEIVMDEDLSDFSESDDVEGSGSAPLVSLGLTDDDTFDELSLLDVAEGSGSAPLPSLDAIPDSSSNFAIEYTFTMVDKPEGSGSAPQDATLQLTADNTFGQYAVLEAAEASGSAPEPAEATALELAADHTFAEFSDLQQPAEGSGSSPTLAVQDNQPVIDGSSIFAFADGEPTLSEGSGADKLAAVAADTSAPAGAGSQSLVAVIDMDVPTTDDLFSAQYQAQEQEHGLEGSGGQLANSNGDAPESLPLESNLV